ncbi:MAG: heme exporter protein CcmB [Polyangiaceae bacterium]|nr:heme exporter protein CcmB [Polyangiaceae bacterium]
MSDRERLGGPALGTGEPGARRTPRTGPSWLACACLVVAKDLRLELRSGEVTTMSGFFALLVVIMASMAFYGGPATGRLVAAGAVWLSIAFAGVLAVGQTWQHEREDGALRGLLVAPVPRSAIFAGKAAALALFLFVIEAVVVPVAALLFALDSVALLLPVAIVALCATPGIAATTTLFGTMTRSGARNVLLAVAVFPLLAPTLLAAVSATRVVLDGAPLGEITDHLGLILLFDGVFTVGGLGLFGVLIEE